MKKFYASFVLVVVSLTTTIGQEDFNLYHMNYIPQAQYLNPAKMPKMNWYYNGWFLPIPLSNNYVSLTHSGFKMSQVLSRGANGGLDYDMDALIKAVGKRNYLTIQSNHEILNFGFKARESYLSFAANVKNFARITYPGDILKLAQEGNGKSLLGNRADFDGTGIDFYSYLEFSAAFARNVNDKLTLGIRPKLLWGMANMYTETSQLGISTSSDLYDLTLDGQMAIKMSIPSDQPDLWLYSQDKNWGGAVDIGADFAANDELSFSVAANDIGFIRWKHNTEQLKSKNVDFTFQGIDLVEAFLLGDSTSDPFQELNDSLTGTLGLDTVSGSIYSTPIPGRVYLSAKYMLGEQMSLSLISRTSMIRGRLNQGLSLGFNYRLKKWLGTSLNVSSYNRKVFNVGAGISLNLAIFQIYFVSDNILPFFSGTVWTGSDNQDPNATVESGSAPIWSYREKNMHGRFGLNMTFGRKDKDADGDKIIDKKDECPNTYGLPQYNGCPDTDEDGIPDKDDNCPTDSGLVFFNGCPDIDGDSIIDMHDECPVVFGLRELNGCPDRDMDGIKDEEDECPDVAGPEDNNGCPKEQLAMINMKSDTLQKSFRNEDDLFVFRDVNPLQDLDFLQQGTIPTNQRELIVIILDKDEAMRLKTKQDDSNPFLYHYLCPKVQAVDENGNILGTAIRGKDGKYRFTNLDPDKSYTFLAIGDEQRIPADLDIIVENPDGVVELKPVKDDSNIKRFNYKPLKKDDRVLLSLLDENGNPVLTSEMDENGLFIFKNLDPDKTYRFSLDGSDPRLKDEVSIMYITDEGIDLMAARIEPGGTYLYQKLSKPLEEVKVELKAEEKEVVDEAFAHLEFETALTVIKDLSLPSLNKLAGLLKDHADWKLHITGHTDDVGDADANLKLSERRAKAVELYFVEQGVPASKFIMDWFGEERPIAPNDTPEGRQKNRRVEMEIVKTK